MRHFFLVSVLAVWVLGFGCEVPYTPAPQNPKPNILIFFIDDMGWRDPAFMGSDFHETPNIDKLAKEGMVFMQSYASAGNCAPSRASLMSGQYTPRHGIYAVTSTDRPDGQPKRLVPVPNNQILALDNYTIAEALSEAGYKTGLFGKWHLHANGQEALYGPDKQGFSTTDATHPKTNQQFEADNDPKDIYKITSQGIDFIKANKSNPFFLFLSHHAVHSGFQARKPYLDYFRAKNKGVMHSNVTFAAMWKSLDDEIGRVLQTLKEEGLDENTLVIFTSDNGGLAQIGHTPLRSSKGSYYEGGIRTPFIARWTGTIKAGTITQTPVINQDLYPTALELAGAKPAMGKTLDGESIVPVLLQKGGLSRQSIFWHFPGYLDTRAKPTTTIRKGDWKLLLFHEEWLLDGGWDKRHTNKSVELYNIAQDMSESKNLAMQEPDKRDELLKELLNWIETTKAPLASIKK